MHTNAQHSTGAASIADITEFDKSDGAASQLGRRDTMSSRQSGVPDSPAVTHISYNEEARNIQSTQYPVLFSQPLQNFPRHPYSITLNSLPYYCFLCFYRSNRTCKLNICDLALHRRIKSQRLFNEASERPSNPSRWVCIAMLRPGHWRNANQNLSCPCYKAAPTGGKTQLQLHPLHFQYEIEQIGWQINQKMSTKLLFFILHQYVVFTIDIRLRTSAGTDEKDWMSNTAVKSVPLYTLPCCR